MQNQLILISDMEGASGIFDENRQAMIHGSESWKTFGRQCITSDVRAVCEAANLCGISEIMLYDGHFAGSPEFNILLEQLPGNVRVFDTHDRCFDWRRIRGQAAQDPLGIITVGQHARNGETDAFFPHTIQTPPIQSFYVNQLNIAEIGCAALSFCGTKYIANIGCAASHKEAREISAAVSCISVKDKKISWRPSPEDSFPIIKNGVVEAITALENKESIQIEEPCSFALRLTPGYIFCPPKFFPWKGHFEKSNAFWEAPDVSIGLELFNYVRGTIQKAQTLQE